MDYKISCDTFTRLLNIFTIFNDEKKRDFLKSIMIEKKHGRCVAVATNAKIAAIEYLGECDPSIDAGINLTIHPDLAAQCKTEAMFNGEITIIHNEVLKFASAKTTMGYNFPGNALAAVDPIEVTWRDWLQHPMPTVSNGAMVLEAESIANLALASPSGVIVFPTFIDAHKVPVVVNDSVDDNWIGVFMPNRFNDGEVVPYESAVVHEWAQDWVKP